MPMPTLVRRLSAMLLLGLLGQVLVACSDTAPPQPASPAPAQPAPSVVVPADPTAIDVETLLRDAAAQDGKQVRVSGNFLADAGSAQLCTVLMESYPPQCGGGVRVTGAVPADTLAALTTTTEPGLKKAWWGFVTVTGTFHASAANGLPGIELGEIILAEGWSAGG